VRPTTEKGTPALLFVQRSSTPRGVGLDSIWVDARSWAPLRHVAATPGGTVNVSYRNGRIAGRVIEGDSARTIDAEVPGGMFDYSVASMAVKSLPLCEGAVIRVAGYDAAHGPRDRRRAARRVDRRRAGGRAHRAHAPGPRHRP
jgi:hypothetical protein